jgi:hypothetical protein
VVSAVVVVDVVVGVVVSVASEPRGGNDSPSELELEHAAATHEAASSTASSFVSGWVLNGTAFGGSFVTRPVFVPPAGGARSAGGRRAAVTGS